MSDCKDQKYNVFSNSFDTDASTNVIVDPTTGSQTIITTVVDVEAYKTIGDGTSTVMSATLGNQELNLTSTNAVSLSFAPSTNTINISSPVYANSGQDGRLAYYNGAGTKVDDAIDLFYNDTSKLLGIQTTSPTARLTVSGSTSDYLFLAESDSYNVLSLYGDGRVHVTGTVSVLGNVNVTGTLTADRLTVSTVVSSSVIYESGSTKFGDTLDDTHQITGSLLVTGSSHYFTGSIYAGYISGSDGDFTTLQADYLDLNGLASDPAYNEGRLFYNSDEHLLSYWTDLSDVHLHLGQQLAVRVQNETGGTVAKGTFVYFTGSTNTDTPRFKVADYSSEETADRTIGVTMTQTDDGDQTFALIGGILTGVNTNSFNSGDIIYLSSSGGFTNVEPSWPNHAVKLGEVVRKQSNNGSILVNVDAGGELEDVHDVILQSTSSGDLLVASNGYWQNTKQLTGSYGLTGSIDVTGNLTASGHVSASIFYGDGSSLTGISATPGGSDTHIQFNDGGSFGGSANLTWDDINFKLTGSLIATGSSHEIIGQTVKLSGSTIQNISKVFKAGNSSNDDWYFSGSYNNSTSTYKATMAGGFVYGQNVAGAFQTGFNFGNGMYANFVGSGGGGTWSVITRRGDFYYRFFPDALLTQDKAFRILQWTDVPDFVRIENSSSQYHTLLEDTDYTTGSVYVVKGSGSTAGVTEYFKVNTNNKTVSLKSDTISLSGSTIQMTGSVYASSSAGASRIYLNSNASYKPWIGTSANQMEINAGSYGIYIKSQNGTRTSGRILNENWNIGSGAEPDHTLHVRGDTKITGSLFVDGDGGANQITGSLLVNNSSSASSMSKLFFTSGSSGPELLIDASGSSGGNEAKIIFNDGNLQGTTSQIRANGGYLYIETTMGSGKLIRLGGTSGIGYLQVSTGLTQVSHQFKAGTVAASNHQFTGSVDVSANITASGHVSASVFYGDGSSLTGISATPGGSDNQIQFNDGGSFAGSSNLTWDDTNLNITGSLIVTGSLTSTGPFNVSWLNTETAIFDSQAIGPNGSVVIKRNGQSKINFGSYSGNYQPGLQMQSYSNSEALILLPGGFIDPYGGSLGINSLIRAYGSGLAVRTGGTGTGTDSMFLRSNGHALFFQGMDITGSLAITGSSGGIIQSNLDSNGTGSLSLFTDGTASGSYLQLTRTSGSSMSSATTLSTGIGAGSSVPSASLSLSATTLGLATLTASYFTTIQGGNVRLNTTQTATGYSVFSDSLYVDGNFKVSGDSIILTGSTHLSVPVSSSGVFLIKDDAGSPHEYMRINTTNGSALTEFNVPANQGAGMTVNLPADGGSNTGFQLLVPSSAGWLKFGRQASGIYTGGTGFELDVGAGKNFIFNGAQVRMRTSTTPIEFNLNDPSGGSVKITDANDAEIFKVEEGSSATFTLDDTSSGVFKVVDNNASPYIAVSSSSDIIQFSGSTIQMTGSVKITGSLEVAGDDPSSNTLYTTIKKTVSVDGTVLHTLSKSDYRAAFYDYSVVNGTNIRAGQIAATHDGTSVNYYESKTTDFGSTSDFELGVIINGSNIELTGSVASGTWEFKAVARGI